MFEEVKILQHLQNNALKHILGLVKICAKVRLDNFENHYGFGCLTPTVFTAFDPLIHETSLLEIGSLVVPS